MTDALRLDARLDLAAAASLHAALCERMGIAMPGGADPAAADGPGGPVSLDAGGVTHLGGLCLQILLAAAARARAAGTALTIAPRSPQFDAALGVFGLSLADVTTE